MIYKRKRIKIITSIGETVSGRLHQGSALRQLSFLLVLDVLREGIRNEESWDLLYADDLVITAEKEEELRRRVVEWQDILERGDLRVNVYKTEAMVRSKEGGDRVALHESKGAVIKQVEQFRYLGSIINQEGRCEAEVENRVKAQRGKRSVYPVTFDSSVGNSVSHFTASFDSKNPGSSSLDISQRAVHGRIKDPKPPADLVQM
ncbi:uncharacterized protein [Palaemon carinicauda]|uniref:uncharacterized protein n=1 Tax=Palaemon carinicauda TaxID=392227 RepID=UPI0035B5ACF3